MKIMNEIQFILYSLPDEEGKVQVVIRDETMWATQKAMAQLFGVGVPAISKHLSNIYTEGELDKETTLSKMEIVVKRGFRGEVPEEVDFYNLDAIIAVPYRTRKCLLHGAVRCQCERVPDLPSLCLVAGQRNNLSPASRRKGGRGIPSLQPNPTD